MTFRMTPTKLCVAGVAWVATAWGSHRAGGSVIPGGPLDEAAHLLTTLLIVWALGARARRRLLVPALVATVAIDIDHVPGRLGADWLTSGTPRPYTHSLIVVAGALLGALLWRRRAGLLAGVALGFAAHLWRDLAESGSGVSLLWPFSDRAFTVPFACYAFAIVAIFAIDASRFRAGSIATPSPSPPADGLAQPIGKRGCRG
jgi:membrane-bound metal-dependent hydrolase YbcI (DUF457 family)